MKKTYEKPMIWFEDFKISANIASCGKDVITNSDTNSCYYDFGGRHIFSDAIGSMCTSQPQDGDDATICYHVPTDTTNLFGS